MRPRYSRIVTPYQLSSTRIRARTRTRIRIRTRTRTRSPCLTPRTDSDQRSEKPRL